jgi:3-phosphoshikimate 1-carboxyvinyltransferase
VKSAILLAGLFAEGRTTVIEPARSRDHTERLLGACGQVVETDGREVTLVPAGALRTNRISVSGDFSSAAFFLVAGLILPDSDLTIEGVGVNPTRTGLLDVLQAMGGVVEVQQEEESGGEPRARLRVRTSRLKGVSIGGDLIPRLIDEIPAIGGDLIPRLIDEIPALAVAAACAEGKTIIQDAAELRVKESDRIRAIAMALNQMGVRTEEIEDGLIIHGCGSLRGASCESHGDHRMAMAFTVAGLRADNETTVLNTACIQTSFPGFVQTLQDLFPGSVEQKV